MPRLEGEALVESDRDWSQLLPITHLLLTFVHGRVVADTVAQAVTKVKAIPAVNSWNSHGNLLPQELAREGAEATSVRSLREGCGRHRNVALQDTGVGTLHVVVGLLAKEPGTSSVNRGIEVLGTRVADVSIGRARELT